MKLNHGLHLAYCTNIHRGETWIETFNSLKRETLAVRDRVCPKESYAIGLRLSQRAAFELSDHPTLLEFQRWLDRNRCYIFTINGFPFGRFHGGRVKEQVYLPDWTSHERLVYTNLLFDLLSQLVPPGVEGSVSTLPGSFKEFVHRADETAQIRANIWQCVEHIARVSAWTGRILHLGLEPEPLCLIECRSEVVDFFDRLRTEHKNDSRLDHHLGVNYDTCHFAVEFEEPQIALAGFREHGIKISKFHLSSALKVVPTPVVRAALASFADDIYLHQVIVRRSNGARAVYRDLADALAAEPISSPDSDPSKLGEWRIHFHIPLHSPPNSIFDTTADHLLGVLDLLQADPNMCSHLEMETYTWEVLPPELKSREVVSQLAAEYDWALARLSERGLYRSI